MHVLSVLTNLPPGVSEEGFHRWYDQEHLPERVAVPGVLWAARYEFASGDYRYAALYALRDDAVLSSPAYQNLADPATWSTATREYFPALAKIMRRDVFHVVAGVLTPEDEFLFQLDGDPSGLQEMKVWCEAALGRSLLAHATANLLLSSPDDAPVPEFRGSSRMLAKRI